MPVFDPIDHWFEKGFRIGQQKSKKTIQHDAIRERSGISPARHGAIRFSGNAKIKNIKSVIRKAPEVMVKITGNSTGLKTVKHHLDYISRNGKLELINEAGESINGTAELRAFREQLKAAQIPNDSNKREFLHVMFSMPPGTPEKALRDAVAEFCQEEFSNRRYVMAFHDDKDHKHVHVCVSTRDIDRANAPQLSPRKADLFRWRQGFADKLREQGVDAAASERRHRFNYRKSEHHVVRQIRADNPNSAVFDSKRAIAKAQQARVNSHKAFVGPARPPRIPKVYEGLKKELQTAIKTGNRPQHPAYQTIEASRKETLARWSDVAKNLEQSGNFALAQQVREMMKDGDNPFISRNQALYDLASTQQSINRKHTSKEQGDLSL